MVDNSVKELLANAPEKTLNDVNEALRAIGIDVDEAVNRGD